MPISIDRLREAARRVGADLMHSDDDLSQKLEPATPEATAEAGPSHDELVENSHDESGVGVIDGEIRSPERQNVSAVRDAIEAQAEMEIGKTIGEKEEEMAARGDGPYGDKEVKDNAAAGGATEVTAKPGTQIIINVAGKKQAAREFVVKHTTVNDSRGPKTGWWIFEDGRPSGMRASQEEAVQAAEATAQLRIVNGQVAPVRVEAGQKEQPIGGEKQHPRENTSANGMFGGTNLSATPNFEKHSEEGAPDPDTVARVRGQYTSGMGRKSCMEHFKITEQQLDDILSGKYGKGKFASYHEVKAAFLKKGSFLTIDEVKKAGQEYLHMIRTAAINVAQGQ